VGLNCIGLESAPKICENAIEHNKNIGILISIGNKA